MDVVNRIQEAIFANSLEVDTVKVGDGPETDDFGGQTNHIVGFATGDTDYAFVYLHEDDHVMPVELEYTPPVLQ